MRALAVLSLSVALSACTTAVVDDASSATLDLDAATGDEGAVAVPAEWGSERLYLGHDAQVYVDRTRPSGLLHLVLIAGARVDVRVDHEDGRRRTGLRAYRLGDDGRLRFAGELTGRGGVRARLASQQGGTFVLEVLGTYPARQSAILTISAACARTDEGRCIEARQPGELCGTHGSGVCDDGLFCDFRVDTMCGAYDAGGSCAVPAQVCPAVIGPQVCGCDGTTYNSACEASMAGVALATSEPCLPPVCDPAVYDLVKDDGASPEVGPVAGTWLFHGATEAHDVESTLRLLNDGTFTYDQVWHPQCLRSDPPCRVASRVLSMEGTWLGDHTGVQLMPRDPDTAPAELAQALTVVVNCEGDVRLRTTELGMERDFIIDRCADVVCADGEVCVLEQMMCIRAPCPPLPTCVEER